MLSGWWGPCWCAGWFFCFWWPPRAISWELAKKSRPFMQHENRHGFLTVVDFLWCRLRFWGLCMYQRGLQQLGLCQCPWPVTIPLHWIFQRQIYLTWHMNFSLNILSSVSMNKENSSDVHHMFVIIFMVGASYWHCWNCSLSVHTVLTFVFVLEILASVADQPNSFACPAGCWSHICNGVGGPCQRYAACSGRT